MLSKYSYYFIAFTKEVLFSCLFVYSSLSLLVCKQYNTDTIGWIFMKKTSEYGSWSNFDLNHGLDTKKSI